MKIKTAFSYVSVESIFPNKIITFSCLYLLECRVVKQEVFDRSWQEEFNPWTCDRSAHPLTSNDCCSDRIDRRKNRAAISTSHVFWYSFTHSSHHTINPTGNHSVYVPGNSFYHSSGGTTNSTDSAHLTSSWVINLLGYDPVSCQLCSKSSLFSTLVMWRRLSQFDSLFSLQYHLELKPFILCLVHFSMLRLIVKMTYFLYRVCDGRDWLHFVCVLVWQSPRGKRVVTHWASMLRWIWSISECNPNGIPTRSIENIRWHSPLQALTAKHVLYPQLTATIRIKSF